MFSIDERDKGLLLRIMEHCDRIRDAQKRFGNSLDSFANDQDYRDVINMNIFQIGELSNHLSEETKEKLHQIPWHRVYGIRNIMAHAYITLDSKTIWDTVVEDIPELKRLISRVL